MTQSADPPALRRTPLYDLHIARGARMVAFAGYEMPVQYPPGIIAEHLHTRAQAGLFDVSHMGQIRLIGGGAAAALEALVPGDLQSLAPGRMRYTLLLNEAGGILDDLMATRTEDGLLLVVNAARKEADLAHLKAHLDPAVAIEPQFERALLALQGPHSAAVLARLADGGAAMPFMSAAAVTIAGAACGVARSGYTGEDGFELSLAAEDAARVAAALLAEAEVMPIGLGARDTLRLEAGLCLYGHDIDASTTPIEAGLGWAIPRGRRAAGGFPGADVILRQLAEGPARKRVGIRPDGRAPAREGTAITDPAGNPVGWVTSGGFGPSVGAPIAMGYVDRAHSAQDGALALVVRDVPRPAHVAALPFVPHRYFRGLRRPARFSRRTAMADTRFSKDHEWVRREGDVVVIGITDYAQEQLGDVVYVELPEIGRRVEQGKEVAVVESAKAASEVYAPVSGEVVAVNDAIVGDPARVNADALGEGWFLKLRPANPAEFDALMDQTAYDNFVAEQH